MDRQQSDQTGTAPMPRPAVMENLSMSQLSELEAQFDQGDRQGFDWRAGSFGWPSGEADRVWNWFAATRRGVKPA